MSETGFPGGRSCKASGVRGDCFIPETHAQCQHQAAELIYPLENMSSTEAIGAFGGKHLKSKLHRQPCNKLARKHTAY